MIGRDPVPRGKQAPPREHAQQDGGKSGRRFAVVRPGPEQPPGTGGAAHLLTDETMEMLVEGVAQRMRSSAMQCAFEVGKFVADAAFKRDPAGWHQPGPKAVTVRGLATRLSDLGICSPQTLHGCLGTFELGTRRRDILTMECLTPAHVRELLRLPQPAQDGLLREVEANGWSVRDLRRAVRARYPRSTLGRPPTPGHQRAIGQVESLLAPDGLAFRDMASAAAMDEATAEDLHTRYKRQAERMAHLAELLSPRRLRALREKAARRELPATRAPDRD